MVKEDTDKENNIVVAALVGVMCVCVCGGANRPTLTFTIPRWLI